MCSLQELSANWLLPQAPGRSVPGARETYYTRIPWQRTTSHLTTALRYRGILMCKVLPRNLYSMECHTCNHGSAHYWWHPHNMTTTIIKEDKMTWHHKYTCLIIYYKNVRWETTVVSCCIIVVSAPSCVTTMCSYHVISCKLSFFYCNKPVINP